MNDWTHAFGASGVAQRDLVGGKGAGLSRLFAAGVPVPPAFVVTTDAYREFLLVNNLASEIDSLMASVDCENADQLAAATATIRSRIELAELPSDIRDEIERSYLRLDASGNLNVAVRSSGTAEDMEDASFAGLYDSYLDIRGSAGVVEAVRRCWASLWTARCAFYRNRLGLSASDALVAVVVQKMVAPQCAGVLFTANPLNGRTDEIVINSNYGLGESIASGIVTPDELVLDAENLDVKRSTLGSKLVRVDRAASGQGTSESSTAACDQDVFSLNAVQARELATLAMRIASMTGGIPQDVEWAMSDGQFQILQSRDITGVEFFWEEGIESWQNAPDGEMTVWTHNFAKSFWNGAVTPLFYSVRARELRDSDLHLFPLWGFDDLVSMRRFKYRRSTVYYSSDVVRLIYRRTMPARVRKHNLDNLPPSWRKEEGARPLDFLKWLRMHLRTRLLTSDQGPFRSQASSYKFMRTWASQVLPKDNELRALSDDALQAEFDSRSRAYVEFQNFLRPVFHIYAPTAFSILKEMLQKWYDGSNEHVFQLLITGMSRRSAMAQEQVDLWELVQTIRNTPSICHLLSTCKDGATFFREVVDVEGGKVFNERYRAFLHAHGHRGHQDRDIWFQRRCEDPEIDFRNFRSMVDSNATSPETNEHRLVRAREDATLEVLQNIRGKPFGRMKTYAFKAVLSYVLDFLVLRDDERPVQDAIAMAKKRVLCEIGRRLHGRGLVAQADDFYFLSLPEIRELQGAGRSGPLVEAKVRSRRANFEKALARAEVSPDYLQANHPLEFAVHQAVNNAGILQGAAISHGTATGTARIISDLRDIGKITEGEILICNSTDPGWTPVFGLLSGIVIEAGGMLSHGACLSREYGLPAVTLPDAMKRIPDGALVCVDGNTGQIRIAAETRADDSGRTI